MNVIMKKKLVYSFSTYHWRREIGCTKHQCNGTKLVLFLGVDTVDREDL